MVAIMRLFNGNRSPVKLLAVLCLCLICPGVLSGQVVPDNSTPPEVLILNFSRSVKRQRYLPRNWEHSPEAYPRRTYPPGVEGLPSTEGPMKRMKTRLVYSYALEIKNIGTQKITGVVWDYVFVGTADGEEVATLQFRNRAKVAANKSFTLSGESLEPPRLPKVVSVGELVKEGEGPYRERVEIKCVLYDGGGWWRSTKATERDCESLMSGRRKGK